eukprot:4986172-Pleurochrysis_carterae.AAC.3
MGGSDANIIARGTCHTQKLQRDVQVEHRRDRAGPSRWPSLQREAKVRHDKVCVAKRVYTKDLGIHTFFKRTTWTSRDALKLAKTDEGAARSSFGETLLRRTIQVQRLYGVVGLKCCGQDLGAC